MTVPDQSPADQSLVELLEAMSGSEPGPAAGSAAGVAVAMAAALLGKTARLSHRRLVDPDRVVQAADAWRVRAMELADADTAAVRAMTTPGEQPPDDPSAVVREIGELAGQVARLARRLTDEAKPTLRADAATAAHLADAAQSAAVVIARANTPS